MTKPALEAMLSKRVVFEEAMAELNGDILKEITNRLVERFDPQRIVIFGSHAWGSPDQNSDLDILVLITESSLPPAKRDAMAHRCLRGIRIPMDILVKTNAEFEKFSSVPASLEYKINRSGRTIYG